MSARERSASAGPCFAYLAIALLVCLPGTVFAQVDWHPTDLGKLGTFGNQRSFAQDINDAGHVVGWSEIDAQELSPPTYDNRAFLWTPAGGMIDLGTLGGPQSIGYGINNNGQVVGFSRIAGTGLTTYHAFLWTAAGGMTDLGVLGGNPTFSYSIGRDINDAGQVAGYGATGQGLTFHAFRWTAASGLQDLGTLGGMNSQAFGIDSAGRVVGWAHTPSLEIHAFLWTPGVGMQDLGVLPGTVRSEAMGINDAGQVVGAASDAGGKVSAFLWTAAGGLVPLGTLPGASSSQALGINDAGTIVGRSGSDTDPERWRPFFWTPSRGMVEIGVMHTLNSWASATAINEAGQIAGYGSAWGPFHAGLWIPWEDLVLDFGPGYGVWTFHRGIDGNGEWAQVHPLSPQKLMVANVDIGFGTPGHSMHDDLVFDFGPGLGLWVFYNRVDWRALHQRSPTLIANADLDNDSVKHRELICVFPGLGIYRTQAPYLWWPFPLHQLEPTVLATGELDGTPGAELLASFPGFGLWRYDEGAGWSLLHASEPSKLLVADLDGNGRDDAIAEFPGFGLWALMNLTTWRQIHSSSAVHVAAANLDGAGGADLIVDFGPAFGIWTLRNTDTWAFLHGLSSEGLLAADVDGNGSDDAVIDFGAGVGLWANVNGTTWRLIHSLSPKAMGVGRFH